MSFAPRTTTIRASSGLNLGGSQNSQSSALQARIHEKKSELESLRQLRDLSAGLAGQMQQLEEKLATLSDGTEAVAAVMANWGSVLRAVSMASGEYLMWFYAVRVREKLIACSGNSKAERRGWW